MPKSIFTPRKHFLGMLWQNFAILQTSLAKRDPQLAILYSLTMGSLVFLGGGRSSLDAKVISRNQQQPPAELRELNQL